MWRNFASRKKMAGARFIDLRARARQFQIIIKQMASRRKTKKIQFVRRTDQVSLPPPLFSPLIDWAIVFAGNDSGRNGLPPKPRRIDNKRSIRVPRHSATSASCSSANKRKRNDIRLFRAPNPSTTREEKVLGRRQYRRIFHPHWLNKKLVFVFCWESAGGAFGFDSKVKI